MPFDPNLGYHRVEYVQVSDLVRDALINLAEKAEEFQNAVFRGQDIGNESRHLSIAITALKSAYRVTEQHEQKIAEARESIRDIERHLNPGPRPNMGNFPYDDELPVWG